MLLGQVGADLLPPTSGGVTVEIDWNKSGDYAQFGDDVTSQVRPNAQAVSVEYGRDQSTALSPTVAGRGGFTLDNRDRRYTPRYVYSPLFGKLKPGRPVRITRQIGSTVYGLFFGHTDDSPINPDPDSMTVSLTLLDSLADFRGQTISTPLYRDIRTGEAIGYVLDACGWTGPRDLDLGATVIPWWWEDNTDAFTALEKIVRSEGIPALLSIGANGAISFRDRHHRYTRTNSLTSQDNWYSGGSIEPVMARGYTYDESWSNLINQGTASVDVRSLGELGVVWTSDATITLGSGEQQIVTVTASDPFFNAITPALGVDYQVPSGTVAVRLINTSGLSAGVELTAGNSGAIVTNLQLRAQPLTVAYTVQVKASDSQSIADYGPRSFPGDLPWCGPGDAQAILSTAVALRSSPTPIVTAKFVIGTNYVRCQQILERDIGDLVTLYEDTIIDGTHLFIESIKHELTSQMDHTVTFGLEMRKGRPAGISTPPLRFDAPTGFFGIGAFDEGVNYSTTLFRFDDANGFAIGAFAA